MRVMVFAKATEDSKMEGPPTPEQLEAFAAMDRFTEELVKAGVFVAAAGLKNGAQASTTSEPRDRSEPALAASESACRGVRGAKPLGSECAWFRARIRPARCDSLTKPVLMPSSP
jgi:hypothetical protein